MSGHGIELTRRRLLGAATTVGASGAVAGAGTFALFSDTETSANNTVQAGTLELGYSNSGSFSFDANMAPTQSTTGTVTLVSSGSISGSLDVDVIISESDAATNPTDRTAQEIANNLTVDALTYGGTDLTGQLPSSPTLTDLVSNDQSTGESTANDLVNLADPGSGSDFTVTLTLADVGNSYQADGVNVSFVFTLNQQDSQ